MAIKIATNMVEAIRYKLRKFDINLEVSEAFLCNNNSVVKNFSVPSKVLNKNTTIDSIIGLDKPRMPEQRG